MGRRIKLFCSILLASFYRTTAGARRGLVRLRSHALLASQLTEPLDSSVVIMGPAEVYGTGKIRIGRETLLYPAQYLETRDAGSIAIGDCVVLSRGVHISSRYGITIGNGTMIGEYASIRDVNHDRVPGERLRDSGYVGRAIEIGNEVWIGRGVTVLSGVTIGDGATVGANAVVTRDVAAGAIVAGVPARPIGASKASQTRTKVETLS